MTVIDVLLFTVKLGAAVPPKVIVVTPRKFTPVRVTTVPPAVGPVAGEISKMDGWLPYVKSSPAVFPFVPAGVVTVTSTVPAECAGVVAVIVVLFTTVNVVAFVPPNFTAVAPVNPVPTIVTAVPPATGPVPGVTDVIVGPPVYV